MVITLSMLRLLSSKARGCKNMWKSSKPCHVGIHGKALAECSQMSTHMPGSQSFFRFFASFCIGQIGQQQQKGNPILLVANLVNIKWWQKAKKWLKPQQMHTHLIVLSKSFLMNTKMTGLLWFSKFLFAFLCIGRKWTRQQKEWYWKHTTRGCQFHQSDTAWRDQCRRLVPPPEHRHHHPTANQHTSQRKYRGSL